MDGRCCSQVDNMLTLYFDDPSSNPAEAYSFLVNFLKRTKIDQKMLGLWDSYTYAHYIYYICQSTAFLQENIQFYTSISWMLDYTFMHSLAISNC